VGVKDRKREDIRGEKGDRKEERGRKESGRR